jgi:hypothetical protein
MSTNPNTQVTFRIEDFGNVVRLSISEGVEESVDPRYREGGRKGWPMIVAGLKTLLETGKPLALDLDRALKCGEGFASAEG